MSTSPLRLKNGILLYLIGTFVISLALPTGGFSLKGFFHAPGREMGKAVGGFFGGIVGETTAPTINQGTNAGKELINLANKSAEERIAQVDGVLKARITQVDDVMKTGISQVDGVLKARTEDVDRVLASRIAQMDVMLEERIDDLDELTEKRVGNVDVVATKAALTFEEVFKRVLAAACIMAFLTFAFWLIYKEGIAVIAALKGPGKRVNTFWQAMKEIFKATRSRLAFTLIAALILIASMAFLPGGPSARRTHLKEYHSSLMAQSLEALDFREVAYHASQLKILGSSDMETRLLLLKADLAKELFIRSTGVQTDQGVAKSLQLFQSVDSELNKSKQSDADIYILKGLFLWRISSDRLSEQIAIATMAKGLTLPLKSSARAPSFRGIAGSYLLNYLDFPIGRLEGINRASAARGLFESGLLETTTFAGVTSAEVAHLTSKETLEKAVETVIGILPEKGANKSGDISFSAKYVSRLNLPADYLPYALYNARISELRLRSNPQYAEMVMGCAKGERTTVMNSAKATVQAWDDFADDVIKNTNPSLDPQIAIAPFFLPDAIQARALAYVNPPDLASGTQVPVAPSAIPPTGPTDIARSTLRSQLDREVLPKIFPASAPASANIPRGDMYGMIAWDETLRFQIHEAVAIKFEEAVKNWRELEKERGKNSEEVLVWLLKAAEHAAGLGLVYWDAERGVRPLEDFLMYEQGVDESLFRKNPLPSKQLDRVLDAKLVRHRGLL